MSAFSRPLPKRRRKPRRDERGAAALRVFEGITSLPYWERDIALAIEPWMSYACDFNPVTVNALFGDDLGRIAKLAICAGSEFLYMESRGRSPVGTLVPENLIRPRICSLYRSSFTMIFGYSQSMESALYHLTSTFPDVGAGITVCNIWRKEILVDECKVLVAVSEDPFFDTESFLIMLEDGLGAGIQESGANVPYFAEKFGYRRASIMYETDDVTQMNIVNLLMGFEFDEIRQFVGPIPELSLDNL